MTRSGKGRLHRPALFPRVLLAPYSALKFAGPLLGNSPNRNRAILLTFDQFCFGSHAQAFRVSHQAHAPPR